MTSKNAQVNQSAETQTAPIIPGMTEVSREKFFAFLHEDSRDIMPSLTDPTFSNWETKDRQLIGRTYPGWRNPSDKSFYMLKNCFVT